MAPYNPPDAHFTQISTAQYTEKQIIKAIGKQGKHFKRITEETGVQYIYWVKETNAIEIWGPKNLSKAKCALIRHLEMTANPESFGDMLLDVSNIPNEVMGKVIGKGGKNFKDVSNQCKIKNIFWHKDTKHISFNGPDIKCTIAKLKIQQIIRNLIVN